MKKAGKGQPGYINYLKFKSIAFIVISALICAFVYGLSYVVWKTNANIGTVVAIVSLLPACKRVVNIIVTYPFKSTDKEVNDLIESKVDKRLKRYSDFLFASEKYILKFDYVVITNTKIYVLSSMNVAKTEYAVSYIQDKMQRHDWDVHVVCSTTTKDYIKKLSFINDFELEHDDDIRYLETFLV